MLAVDFSFSRPTIAQLKAAGVTIVIRYLTGAGKSIGPAELAGYVDAGLAVVFVFEVTTTDVAGGAAAGTAHAQQALAALAALHIPACVVYFAVDEDVDPQAALPYFQGITAVLRPSLVGAYAEGALCQLLHDRGLATWFWQTESTGFEGNATTLPITHLQQKFGGSPVPGTDLNIVCKPDVGQWPAPAVGAIPTTSPSTPTTPGDDEMFPANPTEQQFFATIRTLWYLLRKDSLNPGWFNLMWSLWSTPAGQVGALGAKGFGGDWDNVVANIHDTATPANLK